VLGQLTEEYGVELSLNDHEGFPAAEGRFIIGRDVPPPPTVPRIKPAASGILITRLSRFLDGTLGSIALMVALEISTQNSVTELQPRRHKTKRTARLPPNRPSSHR